MKNHRLTHFTPNPEMAWTIANSVDPDQMPQNAASDEGVHCLPWNPSFAFAEPVTAVSVERPPFS